MFNENGLPIEKKCVIGYIDLMGVEKKIEDSSQWALDWTWIFYDTLKNVLENYERVKIKSFSDNIIICEEIDENNPKLAIDEVLSVLDQLEMLTFKMGALFIRGAVVIDQLHISENFVYGQGLIKAYRLEENTAINPRIIIDSSVLKLIDSGSPYLVMDNDGYSFYDFIQSRIDQGGERLFHELDTLEGNILVNLKSKNISKRIISKMKWMIDYFNKTCLTNGINRCIILP